MKYKKVGKIENEISAIGLGCWAFAGEKWWGDTDDQNSIKVIQTCLDHGINLLDVAACYGQGHSEEVVGKAIKGRDRSSILINSKCGLLWDENGREYNSLKKESILKEIDDSLRRLDTDYVDIYQLHWPDPETPLEETLEALQIIKDSGKIRYVGVTNYGVDDVTNIMRTLDVASQQGLYNILERNPRTYHAINLVYRTERETLPFVTEHEQAFFPYSPLFQGLLGGRWERDKQFPDNDVRRLNPKLTDERFYVYFDAMAELKVIAEKYGHKINELAINWLIKNPAVTSVIGSYRTVDQVDTNIAALDWEISDDMAEEIKPIVDRFEDF
jgi:aryl-alcohol dehydrogenase-like predicted oxidoreductase